MQPSARYTNVLRSLLTALATAGLPAPVVPREDVRFDSKTESEFYQIHVMFDPEQPAGTLGSYNAAVATVQIQADCWARGTEGEQVAVFDRAEQLADTLADWFRNKTIAILDYVGGSQAQCAWLQLRLTRRSFFPPTEGFQRRMLEVSGFWLLEY